jgi:hypothetical protein
MRNAIRDCLLATALVVIPVTAAVVSGACQDTDCSEGCKVNNTWCAPNAKGYEFFPGIVTSFPGTPETQSCSVVPDGGVPDVLWPLCFWDKLPNCNPDCVSMPFKVSTGAVSGEREDDGDGEYYTTCSPAQ